MIEDVSATGTYFWSHKFGFLNGDGGYIGLQNMGNTVSGQYNTKVAVFSIFSTAIDATPGNCKIEYGNFDGGAGTGTSCRIPYNWTLGHQYRLRTVIGKNSDAAGTWWDGYVTDLTTGVETQIDYIKVPKSWSGINSSIMWTEYFGAHADTCDTHPYARAHFFTPKGNYGMGEYHDFYKSMTDPSNPINPFDGAVHRVWVYGINAGGGTNNLLQSSYGVNTFGPCAPAQSAGDADSNGLVNLDYLLDVINRWPKGI